MDEFDLIRRYFAPLSQTTADVVLGIGDDAALLAPPPGFEIAITTDTLIAGRHFPPETAAADVGWKSLAVNLSDLAAMAARPRWYTLALSLPQVDAEWLEGFAAGLRDLSQQAAIQLVGGDTTRGPLTISMTALGLVPSGQALRRSGARPGDRVYVSGTLGDAALALAHWQSGASPDSADRRELRQRLDRPTPRLALGRALAGWATAAIDLSDGLSSDIGHLLRSSGVGARLDVDRLPCSAAFERLAPPGSRLSLQASGGDDYELLFCLPPDSADRAAALSAELGVPLTDIGEITATRTLQWCDAAGQRLSPPEPGYRHFS